VDQPAHAHGVRGPVTAALVTRMLDEEMDVLAATGALDEDAGRRFGQARTLLAVLLRERTCPEFFTLPAYLRHLAPGCASTPAAVPA
jgi:malate synthase